MPTIDTELRNLVNRYPRIQDPSLWSPLPDRVLNRLADLHARGAPEVSIEAARRPWSPTFARPTQLCSVIVLAIPVLMSDLDWAGRHLLLYFVAAAYALGVAFVLGAMRAWVAAACAVALSAFALVDAISWAQIYTRVNEFDFPRHLALVDTAAYAVIALAAHSLLLRSRWSMHSPPSPWLYAAFTVFCYGACYYWVLLSGPLRDHELVKKLDVEWGLKALADKYAPADVDGLTFMAWLVWLLYGLSGTVSLWLLWRRHSLRVTLRWLAVPFSAYGALGPWLPESFQSLRYLFAIPVALSVGDAVLTWLRSRRA